MARVAQLFVGLALVVGCATDPTAVRLEVGYEASWWLDTFEVGYGDRVQAVAANPEVLIVTPKDWERTTMDVTIIGLREEMPWASGSVSVEMVRGAESHGELVLTRLPCGDWCSEGATSCIGDGVAVCERDAEGCTLWSEPVPCGDDMPFCSLGSCAADCVDECAPNATRCAGPDAVETCGQADSDDCLDWQPAVACEEGVVCSGGSCGAECLNECSVGDTVCSGPGTTTCADSNLDGCSEWGPVVPCPGGQSCSAGVCSEDCTDECLEPLCAGLIFRACGNFDLDDCTELSPGESCVPADDCENGSCTPAGCDLTPILCEDPPDDVCVNSNTLRQYQTVGMCSGGTCDYDFTDTTCDCQGGACQCNGTCEPQTIATGQDWAYRVAVDENYVYWTNLNDDQVLRLGKGSSLPAQVLASAQDGAHHVVVDDTHIYWTNQNEDQVMRLSKSSGAPEIVASSQDGANGLAVDDTNIYWTNYYGDQVMRRAKSGGSPEVLASGQNGARNVFVDADDVYWANAEGNQIRRRAKSGGPIETLATDQYGAEDIVADDTYIYWTCFVGNQVMRLSKSGGMPEPVATNQQGANDLTLDADHVYWTNFNSGEIMRAAKSGGLPQLLADSTSSVNGVAVDAMHVYWTSSSAGQVSRLSRCACGI